MTERTFSRHDDLTEKLIEWAEEHKSDQISVFDRDVTGIPGQDGWLVEGFPQPSASVNGLARIAQPKYDEMLAALDDQPAKIKMLDNLLLSNNNVVLATNHGDLIDIAVTLAAFYAKLKQRRTPRGEPEREDDGIRTGIVISKMITRLGFKFGPSDDPMPATQVLQLVAHEQFLSYPRSASAESRIAGFFDKVKAHNSHMRKAVEQSMGRGALLLAVAPSGTTDKPSANDPNTIILGHVGEGTAKMMNKRLILPVFVDYKHGTKTTFEIGDLEYMQKIDDIHPIMHNMAEVGNHANTGKSYWYEG